jgi:CRP/FNR family cyclic AMP-dependent transcriptional regulator
MTPVLRGKKRPKFDPQTFLSTIDGGRVITTFRRKQTIFAQGDSADAVFYIQKGKARLSVVSKIGKEATIGILNEGDFFGEGCLTGQAIRMCSAVAMSDCTVMRIDKKSMIGSNSSRTSILRYVRIIFADSKHPIRRRFG